MDATFANSAKTELGPTLNNESYEPLPKNIKNEIITRAVDNLCTEQDGHALFINNDFGVFNIKLDNDSLAEIFMKKFNDFLLKEQTKIIEEVTGNDPKRYFRNFVFYERIIKNGYITITWK